MEKYGSRVASLVGALFGVSVGFKELMKRFGDDIKCIEHASIIQKIANDLYVLITRYSSDEEI